ncbi:unnamed protein product [Rotaria sp. Silwood1]|nr:unnamed protein product [Rotaria sp. Silwood1]CAF1644734.1 unnamed protein product [Rotaria sp. Silwood1]CAF3775515.1 unnamed protein product [Rotaria sp. Silwood1]CAF3810846.1 unnamed protein product [Rotaria sp. Silwood1]CAF4734575.1 unnamed protein product [Rotaria sp. Silwood1]
MSTTTITSSITTTNQASIQILTTEMTYYGPIILLVFGITGCLCNFITFTAPQLRKNSCAFYFLMSAVFELLSITFGLISRLAADHLGSPLINTNRVYCKSRAYLISALPLTATYLVLLSSIDRFLSSSVSVRLRSFSQMKIAYRATIVAIAIGFLSCIHILVAYDLRPRCGVVAGPVSKFDGMFAVFWLGVIPHILMLIFGFLTVMNIRREKKRVAVKLHENAIASTQEYHYPQQKTDSHLIMMMLFQVGFSELLILTRMIYYAYYVLAPPLTGYNKMIGSFLMSFTTLVYYANYAKSFYIYTLSSQLFRLVFMNRIKSCIRKIVGRYIRVIHLDEGITNNLVTLKIHH